MMLTAKLISTCLGIGYIQKGAGTVAALLFCVIWYLAGEQISFSWALAHVAAALLLGLWAAGVVEKQWGKDSNRVVIDEWLGMAVSLLALPLSAGLVVCALVLFRFFDILKPLGIRRVEKLPSGWGVMADDLLAGIYTNCLLQLAVNFALF
jgi:phosphatidylglycerophosphatase A